MNNCSKYNSSAPFNKHHTPFFNWQNIAFSTVLLLGLFFISCSDTQATEAYVGVSFGWVNLDGDDINPLESDVKPGFSLAAKPGGKYFNDSRFGYYLEYGLDSYEAETKTVWGIPPSTQTINSHVSGFYMHYTPTFFYDFAKGHSKDWSLMIGAGLGLSYFTVKGTMIINEPSPTVTKVDGAATALSTGLVIRYESKHFVIQAKEYMPVGKINGVEMELQLPLIIIAYKYEI